MAYTPTFLTELGQTRATVIRRMRNVGLKVLLAAPKLEHGSLLHEHVVYGIGRRALLIERALDNVFAAFPPDTQERLLDDRVAEAELNLHAFLINVAGIFDNMAWAYVLRHDLLQSVGGRKKVGLFINATRDRMAPTLRSYLTNQRVVDWHARYGKVYRDALAHRIPPCIPAAEVTAEEVARLREADQSCDLEATLDLRRTVGKPCFTFMHSRAEQEIPERVFLHPQLVKDAELVAECAHLFLEHWHEPPTATSANASP